MAVISLKNALAITVMVGGGLRWVLGAWPGTSSGLQAASLLRLLRHPAGHERLVISGIYIYTYDMGFAKAPTIIPPKSSESRMRERPQDLELPPPVVTQ